MSKPIHMQSHEEFCKERGIDPKPKLVWESVRYFKGTDENGVVQTYRLPGRTLVYPEGGRKTLRKLKPAVRNAIRDFYLGQHGAYAPPAS